MTDDGHQVLNSSPKTIWIIWAEKEKKW
jgi:hypothetical protein